MAPTSKRRLTVLGVLGCAICACAVHEARPAYRRGVLVDDRGISVPLPPPSLKAAPRQQVDVGGRTDGSDGQGPGTVLHVVDLLGEAEAEVVLADERFAVEGLDVDLTAHCLDLWLTDAQGIEGPHTHVSARIVDNVQLQTETGCLD